MEAHWWWGVWFPKPTFLFWFGERDKESPSFNLVSNLRGMCVPCFHSAASVVACPHLLHVLVDRQDQVGFSPTHPAKNDPLSKDNLAQLAAQPKVTILLS